MKSLVYTLIMLAIAALAASCSPKVISPATSKVRKAKTLHPVTPDNCSGISANAKPVDGKHYFLIDFKVRKGNREMVGYVGYSCLLSHPTNLLLRKVVGCMVNVPADSVSIVGATNMGRTEYYDFFKHGELNTVYVKDIYLYPLN